MPPRLPPSSETWFGKTVVLAAPPGDGDAPPEVVAVWMTSPEGVVVHSSSTPVQKGPIRMVTSFSDAVHLPAVGSPRVPRRIIVEDRQAGDQLARAWKVVAVVRPIPELDAVLDAIVRVFRPAAVDAAPVRQRPTAKSQLALQLAASALLKTRPWDWMINTHCLAIDAPGDPLDGHAISVLGARGDAYGFALFDSEADARSFWENSIIEPDESPTGCKYTFVAIEGPERLSAAEQRQPAPPELGKRRAVVLRFVDQPPATPTTESDVLTACRVARALATVPRGRLEHEAEGLRLRPSLVARIDRDDFLHDEGGAPLVATEEIYATDDQDQLMAWLDQAPDFERTTDGGDPAWIWRRLGNEPAAVPAALTHGQLVLDGQRLIVSTFITSNAETLAERLRAAPALRLQSREQKPFKRLS